MLEEKTQRPSTVHWTLHVLEKRLKRKDRKDLWRGNEVSKIDIETFR
jgi:hypothetical protein